MECQCSLRGCLQPKQCTTPQCADGKCHQRQGPLWEADIVSHRRGGGVGFHCGYSRRLDFSAMFHTGIVRVIRHSWVLIRYYEKD